MLGRKWLGSSISSGLSGAVGTPATPGAGEPEVVEGYLSPPNTGCRFTVVVLHWNNCLSVRPAPTTGMALQDLCATYAAASDHPPTSSTLNLSRSVGLRGTHLRIFMYYCHGRRYRTILESGTVLRTIVLLREFWQEV